MALRTSEIGLPHSCYTCRWFDADARSSAPSLNLHNHHTANMSDSDSVLSTPPATDDEMPVEVAPTKVTKPSVQKKKKKNGTILSFFEKEAPSPPRKKRAPSPPHEAVPEDNFDVAVSIQRVLRVVPRRDRDLVAFNVIVGPSLTNLRLSSSSCSDHDSQTPFRPSVLTWDRRMSSEVLQRMYRPLWSRVCSVPYSGLSSTGRSLSS